MKATRVQQLGKSNWIFKCFACGLHQSGHMNQFRAIEAEAKHSGTSAHVFNVVRYGFQIVVDAYFDLSNAIIRTSDAVKSAYALMTPANVPHDPALRRDRRKWGGR